MTVSIFRIVAVAALLLAAGAQERPEMFENKRRDLTIMDPAHFTVELKSPCVRVVRARLDAEMITPSHDVVSGVLVALSALHIRVTRTATGRSYDIHLQRGESRYMHADTHSLGNLAGRPAEYVFVELTKCSGGP